MESKSFVLAKGFLNKTVNVIIDRPLGTTHPKWGFEYPINYGYLKDVMAPDGEELDAYVLKVTEPLKEFKGRVIAIVHRIEDDDDKLIVAPDDDKLITNEEIEKAIEFQEKWFKHEITTV